MLQRIILSVILLGTLVVGLQLAPERADAGNDCPDLSINGDRGDNRTAHFAINAIPGVDDMAFNWTVSNGGIARGQGTPSIIAAGMNADYITATVDIGDLNPGCPTHISKTVAFR